MFAQLLESYRNYTWVNREDDVFLGPWPLPAAMCVIYVGVLAILTQMMKDRKEVRLLTFTYYHNVFLSAISFVMFAGLIGSILEIAVNESWYVANCDPAGTAARGGLYFWSYVFYLSKYYEWLDTILLVLKKKELSFLHVYHHILTLWISWGQLHTNSLTCYEPVVLNCLIHTFMYYYYAIATVGRTVFWKRYLTIAQIVQFVVGTTTTFYKGYRLYIGECTGSWRAWSFGQIGIFTFFLLFLRFYFRTYKGGRGHSKDKKAANEKAANGTHKGENAVNGKDHKE